MAVGHPRLVVLRALGLGDFLTAVPALRALARAFPGHRRLLAAPASLRPLVEVLGGAVHHVVDTDFRRLFSPLDPRLRGADIAVNLHGRGPQSHRVLAEAHPGRLLAYDRPDWDDGEHEVDRWCRLLAVNGIAADPTALRLEVAPDVSHAGATVIHPGAASPARRWPADRWAEVARDEAASGREVLLTGGADEVDLARSVAERAGLPPSAVLAGRTDLRALAGLVAGAGQVLCGDTGIAHLATALGSPSVVLFGPVDPARWGPRIDADLHSVLYKGGGGDPHAAAPDPGLLAITVDDVLAAVGDLAIIR